MSAGHNDGPLQEIADEAARVRARYPGAMTWQKWTCAHCGSRQEMDAANAFYDSGRCGACGGVTQITRCGFSLIMSPDAEGAALLPHIVRRAKGQPDN